MNNLQCKIKLTERKTHNSSSGFTFIELIIYVAIISVILMALIPFAWDVIGGGVKSSNQQEVFSQARFVSEKIKYEIRNANSINSVTTTSCASSIDLNTSTNSTTVIDLAAGKIRIKYGAAGTPVNLNSNDTNITCLTFTNYTSGDNKTKNIQFLLTIDDNFNSVRSEYNIPTVTVQSSAEVRSN